MQKLYEEGEDRIDTELDIVKIMKGVRDAEVMLKSSVMDNEAQFQIQHAEKNYINIDDTDEESSDDYDYKEEMLQAIT